MFPSDTESDTAGPQFTLNPANGNGASGVRAGMGAGMAVVGAMGAMVALL